MQDAVAAAGPLLTILGFVVFPILWSVPEALITAELATAFPENSGYVAWVTAAFGPFWGFQVRACISCPCTLQHRLWHGSVTRFYVQFMTNSMELISPRAGLRGRNHARHL